MQPPLKVRSHQDISAYSDVVEKWAIRGNQKADETASSAREDFSPLLQYVWENLVGDVRKLNTLRDDIHGHIVRVGVLATTEKRQNSISGRFSVG